MSVGYFDGYLGEGQLSYGGPNALARARLAGDIVRRRLKLRGYTIDDLRVDLIGLNSLHGDGDGRPEPHEVRLRVAGKSDNRSTAEAVGWEVSALYTNGPYGGAGDSSNVREILAIQSVLLPRELVMHYSLKKGTAVLSEKKFDPKDKDCVLLNSPSDCVNGLSSFKDHMPRLFCVNDTGEFNETHTTKIKELLEYHFPDKAPWER